MNKYCVRARYWHEYTGIGRDKNENLTTNEVCNELNNLQKQLFEIKNLLHKEIKTSKDAFNGLMQENKELRQKIIQLENKRNSCRIEKEVKL